MAEGESGTMTAYEMLVCIVNSPVSTECREWPFARNQYGYGVVRREGKLRVASREVWRIVHGDIPASHNVLHICDNPACVNPGHLFIGSQRANLLDARDKGRLPQAKLTVQQAHEIRISPATGKSLASRYGVSRTQISRIRHHRHWRSNGIPERL